MSLPVEPSLGLSAGFIALPLIMAGVLAGWTRRPLAVGAWVVLTGALSYAGLFESFALPPRMLILLILGLTGGSIFMWRGGWKNASLKFLVAIPIFRIAVELLIHQAVNEGVAPPQFTWTGLNWDIAAGLLALVLFPFADRLPRWALHLANFTGWALLTNIMVVAVLSMPTPFQMITPDNIWVGFFPFAWLPLILVLSAWMGHVALFKRLLEDARALRT